MPPQCSGLTALTALTALHLSQNRLTVQDMMEVAK